MKKNYQNTYLEYFPNLLNKTLILVGLLKLIDFTSVYWKYIYGKIWGKGATYPLVYMVHCFYIFRTKSHSSQFYKEAYLLNTVMHLLHLFLHVFNFL